MADNIVLNAGSGGATLAADDVGPGTWYQIVKLAHGALDSVTLVSTSSGLPVQKQGTWTLDANSGVDIGDVDVTSVTPGTAATNLGKAEDAAHASGDVGVMALGVRQAANAPLSGADLDYEPLQTDANGHLKVNVIDALPAGTNAIGKLAANSGVDIGDVDITSVVPGTGATNLGKAEDAAHSSGDVGVMALAIRDDTLGPLSGTELDYEPLHTDSTGRLHVREAAHGIGATVPTYHIHVPAANTQATITKAAAGVGIRIVCTGLSVVLAAGATAPTAAAVTVALIDGATGGTTYLWRHNITVTATAGVMQGIVIPSCWFEGSQNTAMTLEFSAAGGANTLESVSMSCITITE